MKILNSYDGVRPGHLEDVQKISEEVKRDWRSLLEAIKNGFPMQAPIVIIREDDTPYLVSGNTRLMLARALGVQARVLIARL